MVLRVWMDAWMREIEYATLNEPPLHYGQTGEFTVARIGRLANGSCYST